MSYRVTELLSNRNGMGNFLFYLMRMDMGGDMVEMMNKLKDLKGEEYDKEFLKQMILHHEQAVEMSQYAASNAKHQEIRDLASNIIRTQKAEIQQMKQWQESWGY